MGVFGGNDGNSALPGARVLLFGAIRSAVVVTIARGAAEEDEAGEIHIMGLGAEVVCLELELALKAEGAAAAVPQAPCRALLADGVVEDFIFNTLAPAI